ncbi:RNA-directed DNA polymerase [Fusobacterium sp. oral taxon 370]|nr:RNA-directed DNA polymerase [Fusobacterium sp. oral taxon 370]
MKTYYDFMSEIKPDELYDSLVSYGMFSEKLPSIFTGDLFLNYCKNICKQSFSDEWRGYINYESMRNINIPRNIGIPTPMGHELLCKTLMKHWTELIKYFETKTKGQSRIISRIHIRKMQDTKAIFLMNYKNWIDDGTPEPEIYLGKRYMIHTDISKCYPSIYTHAIPWALVGKDIAKNNIGKYKEWYNQIDHFAQISKNGETHGLLIGPHTSNILSEIILCAIDKELSKKYDSYIRNIDDYICYVDTKEEADNFIIDLNRELRKYDLLMNHKKTEIYELPICVVETWIHKIQNHIVTFQKFKNYIDYREIQAFIDFIIKLVSENTDNNSVILYAVKVLKNFTLTKNAQEYLVKSIVSLSLLYPYLVPILGQYIFEKYNVDTNQIQK